MKLGELVLNSQWEAEVRDEILERVRDYIWAYVKEGSIASLRNLVANITKLSSEDLDRLAVLHFLLSDEVNEFVNAIPSIIKRLAHTTRQEEFVYRGRIRGRVDWSSTARRRLANGQDKSIFACRPPSRSFELPENQLFKVVLLQIRGLSQQMTHLASLEQDGLELSRIDTGSPSEDWQTRIANVRFAVNEALRHVHLREVEVPKQISPRIIVRTNQARNKSYRKAVSSYYLERQLIARPDYVVLRNIVEERVLVPLSDDTLYELFILFEIIRVLGPPIQMRLIDYTTKEIATFRIGGKSVKLYYQRVRDLLESSKYKQMFEDYDLPVAARRPDMILALEIEGKKVLLVEVKRSSDKDYISDSVYKVLGYLADFEEEFQKDQKPKAVLVVWDITRIGNSVQDIQILTRNDIDRIKDYASSVLGVNQRQLFDGL